jgi:transposase
MSGNHREDAMGKSQEDVKFETLRQWGAYNLSASMVSDELFCGHEFFDPRDLVQVKYEMLRRVQQEGLSVIAAARRFGFSRTAFYQAWNLFEEQGMPGLIPKRPGPKEAHKLSRLVMEFVEQRLAQDSSLRPTDLVELVTHEFGLSVHPRSIERALSRQLKKGH